MATFNSANGSFQTFNKTLFEAQMLATPNGMIVSNTNPLPVTLGSSNVNINTNGSINVSVPNTINVASTPENPVHTHLTEVGTSGILNVPYLPIGGNVVVTSVTSNVVVSVNNFPTVTNVNVVSGNVSVAFPATQNVQVLSNTTNYVYTQAAPTWSVDALSKLRVSSTLNQDWFAPMVDNDTSFRWNQSLTGTNSNSVFLANTSEIQMTSGNTASGSAIRQTYSRFKVIPGTSHVVYTTVNFTANTSETGVTRRTGLYDANDGIFWEQNANTLAVVVRRTLANGYIQEDRTYANSFSTDHLDGTGPSGFNIFSAGLNKYYTFWFDLIGGRTGRVRFGLGTPIGPQIVHTQSYAGVVNTNFISNASLPLRREIFNSTSQTTSPTFNMSAISFQSEAPELFNPSPSSAYNINGFIPGSSMTPILSIGLREGSPYTRSDITPGEIALVDLNNQGKNSTPGTYFYHVIYNANVNGTYAYVGNNAVANPNTGRSSQYWTWTNTATVSGGLVLLSGITQSASAQQTFDGIPGSFNLGSDISGNPATLTLAVQQLASGGSTANLVATFNFLEQL